MELNEDQLAAVQACAASIKVGEPITRLFGFAGTGKTTIASDIVAAAGLDMSRVMFAAPTGKAAAVLTRKGCDARTLHALLYQPPERKRHVPADDEEFDEHPVRRCSVKMCGQKPDLEEFRWTIDDAKAYLARAYSLIVVDEASMIGTRLGEDTMSLGIPVLAIGDPMQLQPVNDRQFFMDQPPTAQLEQIMRNKGNVLACAQDIRLHGVAAIRRYPEIAVGSVVQSAALSYSQIIVGRNKTRDAKNALVRQLLGYSGGIPVAGEKIICLRNKNKGLVTYKNGQQFIVIEVMQQKEDSFAAYLECDCGSEYVFDRCRRCSWERDREVWLWQRGFDGWDGERELADMPYRKADEAMMATWGYCITAHKSQGSEWPSVLVLNEGWGKEKVNWLYTAVTRAEDKVCIIKPSGGRR